MRIPTVCITSDLAFLLEPCSQERVREILSIECIDAINHPIIGISISQIISEYYETKEMAERRDSYITVMVQLVNYLINELGATVILLPSVTGPRSGQDDRIIGHQVFERVERRDRVFEITNEYTPPEFRGIVGLCGLFIGARMHANIAALSTYVPTIAIAYSHKTAETMEQCGQEKYVCDIRNMTLEELISKVYDAWNRRKDIREELEHRITAMRENLQSTMAQIKRVLGD
jgi:colanic acid/amylovoran biosynthesis protein